MSQPMLLKNLTAGQSYTLMFIEKIDGQEYGVPQLRDMKIAAVYTARDSESGVSYAVLYDDEANYLYAHLIESEAGEVVPSVFADKASAIMYLASGQLPVKSELDQPWMRPATMALFIMDYLSNNTAALPEETDRISVMPSLVRSSRIKALIGFGIETYSSMEGFEELFHDTYVIYRATVRQLNRQRRQEFLVASNKKKMSKK